MKPSQQHPSNSQISSPYRPNYHINPAESKIVYTSPQNIQPSRSNNISYYPAPNPISVSNPVHYSPPQLNVPHYVKQTSDSLNQQLRPQVVSPVGNSSSNMSQNNSMGLQPQSNPPNGLIFSFQQLSPLHYNNTYQTEYNRNIEKGNVVRSIPISNATTAQNKINFIPSNPQPFRSNSPVMITSTQVQPQSVSNATSKNMNQSFGVQTSIVSQPITHQQQIVSHTMPSIQSSGINIQISGNASTIGRSLPPVILKGSGYPMTQKYQTPQQTEKQPDANSSKQNSLFHMTSSVDIGQSQKKAVDQKEIPKITTLPIESPPTEPIEKLPQIALGSEKNTVTVQNPTSNPIWQQRFMMIYQKFEWFYERYDFISREFQILSQQFENVNSEEQWLELKEKHDLLLEKIQQIHEQLINTINDNQELAEQYELENRNIKQSDDGERLWEHRYHELLEEYKSLSQNYADLQSQGNDVKPSQGQSQQQGMTIEEQAQIQSKFQELQSQYNVLCDQYEKIRVEYERIYEQNTQYNKENNELVASNQQARNMATQLQAYVEELQHENDQLRKQERKSMIQHQNCVLREEAEKMQYHFTQQINKYDEQLQKYRITLQQYEEKAQLNKQQLEKVRQIAMERGNRIKELEASQSNNLRFISNNQTGQNQNHEQDAKISRQKETELTHKLELKEVERKSMQQKIRYLEKQLEMRNFELQKVNRNLDERLLKIQQNTISQLQVQNPYKKSTEDEGTKFAAISQYQNQIRDLQYQLQESQKALSKKSTVCRELEDSVQKYETQVRKLTSIHHSSEIQLQKKISEIQIEMEKRIAEKQMKISLLNSELDRLKETLDAANKEKVSIKETFRLSSEQNERQFTSKFQQKISEYEKKIHQKSEEVAFSRQMIHKYERELKSKNDELIELRSYVTQIKKVSTTSNVQPSRNEFQLLKQDLKTREETLERKNDELTKLKREKEYKVKLISQLQHELDFVNSELEKRRNEISSLRRQLNDSQILQSEYQILRSNFNKKVSEITQLKQDLFEIEKLRMENESQKKDLERFSQDNRDKYKQIERLKQEIYDLERKFNSKNQQVSSNQNYTNNQNIITASKILAKDDTEAGELRELIKRKDSEISRINQLLHENQFVLENKSRQLEMYKSQISALTRSKESEVLSLTHTVSSLQTRLKQSEAKRNKLNDQINGLRTKFEQQLKSQSQRQKSYYEKVIARHEEDYRSLKEKIRAAEQENNKMEMQLQKTKTSEKKFEIEVKELNKKLANQKSQVVENEQVYATFRQKQAQTQQSTKALYEKLSALELQLKTKDQQLKHSEEKNSILEQKIKKNKKDYENFRNKLIVSQQYENNNSVVEYLSKRIAEYESKMINQSERDFGFKVKDTEANNVFENQVVYHLKMQNEMLRKELQGKGIQYDRKILTKLEEENLKISKNLLKNSTFSSKIGNGATQFLLKDNIDDVNFYKEKNKELQQRVERHLQVNKQLKEKIESLIKGSSSTKQIDYYKEQIAQYETKISQLEKRIQILTDENKSISKDITKKHSRVEEKYDQKVNELQSALNQANKAIHELTAEKSILQTANAQLQMQKVTLGEEIKRLNDKLSSFASTKQDKHEEETRKLRENCQNYESQIVKLTNRCRFLEQQIQRLNETNSSNKLSLNELNSLKTKTNELSQQLANTLKELQEEQLKVNGLNNQNANLQVRCRTFESEVQRLTEMNELYLKKQRVNQSESAVLSQQTSGLQVQLSSLQTQLANLNGLKREQQAKISSLTEHLGVLEKIIQSIEFDLQMIRTDVLLEETLVQELVTGGDNLEQCIEGLKTNVGRKLYYLEQIFNRIKSFRVERIPSN